MLKFIPQNENNYEKSAKEELGISSNFLDFFSSEPKEISEKINSTLAELKSSRKVEIFYNKILYYFSFLEKSGTLKDSAMKREFQRASAVASMVAAKIGDI